MKSALTVILATLFLFGSLSLSAERTTRRNLKPKETTAISDTINIDTIDIAISGYDKPLTSRHETFFATNKSSHHITSVTVEFNYTDMSGRQLHSRKVTINCDLPPGQTRQLKTRSWDSQFNFYYHLSPRPRRTSTPYKTSYRIISVK